MKLKGNRAITLIALIVTIIVLLILAGVTIATLTGENGILNQAQGAKTKSETAETEEKIKLALMASRLNADNAETIDLGILEEELQKNLGEGTAIEKTGENGALPWNVAGNKYKYKITEQGEVIKVTAITLSKSQLKLIAGQEPVTLTAILGDGNQETINWSSSDESLVTVENGVVNVVGSGGTAVITASVVSDGKTYDAKCEVSIIQKVASISAKDIEIEQGNSNQLQIVTNPPENIEGLVYTSSDETVATVDNNGKVMISKQAPVGSTATITVTGEISKDIKTTCKITVSKPAVKVSAQQIAENPKAYYGKQVLNYKVSEADTNVYRIFYVDNENYFGDGENTVYLKADVTNKKYGDTWYSSSTTKVKQMNPLWASYRGNNLWNENEKTAAWLCDPARWTGYCNQNLANYAIGGPSVEMYVKSYNQAFENMNENVLGAYPRAENSPGYVYTVVNPAGESIGYEYFTGVNTINKVDYNGMYAKKSNSTDTDYWLASPSSKGSDQMCCVSAFGGTLDFFPCGSNTRS